MDCSDVDQALIKSEIPLPPQADEHASGCPRCQKLLRAVNASAPAEAPSAAILRDIERRIAGDLRPVKPIHLTRLMGALAGIVVCAVGASAVSVGASGLYPGALGVAAMNPVQAGVIFALLAAAAFLLADSLARQMAPGSRHRIEPKILAMVVIPVLAIAVAALFSFQREPNFWAEWWYCFRVGAPAGLVAAALFWLVLRRGAILSPPAAGASAGLLAGLVGATTLEIRCSNLDAWHILLSHFGVAMAGALLGLLAGWYQARHPGLAA
ncbi:MAG TPA: NrsF family protein [Bryobacteraceae bacterium]|nr:NrsF family protein [Bryobacteraceae bacterium]